MNQLRLLRSENQFTSCALEDVQNYVGKGWHPIIESLVDALFTAGWDGVVLQCKEKFGGLRFYINYSPELDVIVNEYETKSYSTCEFCGDPGTRCSPRGWIKTLCDSCKESRYND